MIGPALLGVVSICIRGEYDISPKTDWTESINLYMLVINNPSEKKSPVLKEILRPVYMYVDKENKDRSPRIIAEKLRRNILSKQIENALRTISTKISTKVTKGTKAPKGASELVTEDKILDMQTELADLEENGEKPLTVLADDFTTEALVTVQKYHDTANQIIESGIVALNKAWSEQITARLTDIGYQMGLQNTLEMFKNDLINRPEDAAAIIEVYRRDFPTALELIKKAALQGKEEKTRGYASLIPPDNREHNIKLLRQLNGNVDKYITINAVATASKAWNSFNQGLTGVSASMDSMVEFCEKRLNDDLSLSN